MTSCAECPTKTVSAATGIDYACRELGESEVPLVLLQHFRGNLDYWDPALIDTLAARRRLVLFDNTGVGGSSGLTPSTVAQMAFDTLTFLDAMGLDRVDVLGFSLGSFVAQELALLRPAVVRNLVLASSAPKGATGMHGWAPEVIDAVGKMTEDWRTFSLRRATLSHGARDTPDATRAFHWRDCGRESRSSHHAIKGGSMTTIRLHETTTATPEQFIAGLTDFGPGRAELFPNSTDDYLVVHDTSANQADVTEGSRGIWERLHYDWSEPDRVVLHTTDSNTWANSSTHTYTLTPQPDGKTAVDLVVVRHGKNLKGHVLAGALTVIGKGFLGKAFHNTIEAIEAKNYGPRAADTS